MHIDNLEIPFSIVLSMFGKGSDAFLNSPPKITPSFIPREEIAS